MICMHKRVFIVLEIQYPDLFTDDKSMPLAQLIYISQRTPALSEQALDQIVSASQKRNRDRDITGVLLCCGTNLMQLLEGEQADLDSLFKTISADPRHNNIQCLLQKQVQRRLFPEWGMSLADLDSRVIINRDRLTQMIEDVRERTDTAGYSVESRILLNDFKNQIAQAA
jgi:hypothetical protein